ncbi:unnamed protein product [Heterosigma akashiwo]
MISSLRIAALVFVTLVSGLCGFGVAFQTPSRPNAATGIRFYRSAPCSIYLKTNQFCGSESSLALGAVKVSAPTPEEAAKMGAREWPQNIRKGAWSEDVGEGKVRYVLQGEGTLDVMESAVQESSSFQVGPGTLVEVESECTLNWNINDTEEMVILTPGYEDGKALIGIAALFAIGLGALVASSSL